MAGTDVSVFEEFLVFSLQLVIEIETSSTKKARRTDFGFRLFFVTNFNFQSCPASPEAGLHA
jgi:hypothetical protein